MFGYDVLTTVAALIALGALLSIVPLVLARNFVEIIKPAAIGAGAWFVGGLTTASIVGVATSFVGALLALLNGLLVEIDVTLPFSTGTLVLVVVALALLSKGRGKKK